MTNQINNDKINSKGEIELGVNDCEVKNSIKLKDDCGCGCGGGLYSSCMTMVTRGPGIDMDGDMEDDEDEYEESNTRLIDHMQPNPAFQMSKDLAIAKKIAANTIRKNPNIITGTDLKRSRTAHNNINKLPSKPKIKLM